MILSDNDTNKLSEPSVFSNQGIKNVISFLLSNFDTVLTILIGVITLILYQFNKLSTKWAEGTVLLLLILIAIHLLRNPPFNSATFSKMLSVALKESEKNDLTYTPDSETNYRFAVTSMLSARKVCATYFLRHSWEEKPADLENSEEFVNYFTILNKRILSGRLVYRWIVSIENGDKLNALLRKVKFLMKNKSAIRQGYTSLRVICNKTFSPRVNIQINDDLSLVVGYSIDVEGIGSGFILNHKEIIGGFQKHYDRIWENSLRIIDREIYFDNLRHVGKELGIDVNNKVDEIEQEYKKIPV